MKIFPLTSLLLLCCANLFASETNKLFITINEWDKDVSNQTNGISEYLSAEQFPAGNWGQATNGIQLSLRFDKPAYTNGESIIATILVRNVTNKTADYHNIHVYGRDGPVRFYVFSTDNHNVEGIQGGEGSATDADVLVGSQRKFVERLNKDYCLTNGTYFVQAYVVTGYRVAYAKSAKVPITITNAP
jgi:hypothetical protein